MNQSLTLGGNMKAAQISQYGDSSVVQITTIDIPAPGEGQVLVEVHASSLNPFDTTIRSGYMKDMIPLQFPVTLGGDIAGVVAKVGEGVTNFAVGDAVYGQANVVAGNSGAFAEYAVTSAGQVAVAPHGLEFTDAASLPLVGVSALQALQEHINLQPGQKIFIHGGAGGIGTIAIQVAKHIGAHVATTATGEGIELVKSLGADDVIDYKTHNYADVLKEYDAVFDTVGDDFDATFAILKPGGVAVSMIASANEAAAKELGITAMTQSTHVTTAVLDTLRQLVEAGVIVAQVDQIFSLDAIKEAFDARETGTVRGKIAIEIKQV